MAAFAIVASIAVSACSSDAPATPRPTLAVAAATSVAATSPPTRPPAPSRSPSPAPTVEASPSVGPPPETAEPVGGRTSMDLDVTYDVKAILTVETGALEVTTLLRVRNDSGGGIDHLALNTVAARLGGMRIIEATVDDAPVKVRVDDQTIVVPLGGVLAEGASTEVRIGYRARLQGGLTDPDWLFSRAGGTLALHRWIPWVSRALPFDRPNQGDPFVTPTSRRVDVEILTDRPMVLAAPVADAVKARVGDGAAWAFSAEDVRDVSVVFAPDFKVLHGEARGVPIRVYTRPGSPNAAGLLALARQAVSRQSTLLGEPFPRPLLVIVETEGGEALETPGLIWLPKTENSLNRTYLVHHEVAQQWFYGLVGNDQRVEPFADEAPADFLARSVLNNFRASRCPTSPLDQTIARYSRACYYEVLYVQGGLLLEDLRQRIGNARFWTAMRGYLEAHRLGLGGTKALLEALRAASDVNLLPTLRARFPSLY